MDEDWDGVSAMAPALLNPRNKTSRQNAGKLTHT